jgi:hypothetical protein
MDNNPQRVVHKIVLPEAIASELGAIVELPGDAEIIHFALQRTHFCLWYVTWPRLAARPPRATRFVLRGTGQPLPLEGGLLYSHVGSCFTDVEGTYVFHLFRADQ